MTKHENEIAKFGTSPSSDFHHHPPLGWPPLPLLLEPNSSIVQQQLLLLLPSGPKLALLLVLPTHYLPHPLALFCSAKGPPGPRPTDRGIDMRLGVSAPPYIYPVIPSSSSLQAHRISIISFSARFSYSLPLPLQAEDGDDDDEDGLAELTRSVVIGESLPISPLGYSISEGRLA